MGVEGDTYEIDENGLPQFTDKVMNNPDGMNMEEVLGRLCLLERRRKPLCGG